MLSLEKPNILQSALQIGGGTVCKFVLTSKRNARTCSSGEDYGPVKFGLNGRQQKKSLEPTDMFFHFSQA